MTPGEGTDEAALVGRDSRERRGNMLPSAMPASFPIGPGTTASRAGEKSGIDFPVAFCLPSVLRVFETVVCPLLISKSIAAYP